MTAASSLPVRDNGDNRSAAAFDRAFLMDRRDVELGLTPAAEPVVLVPVSEVGRFPATRILDVGEPPRLLDGSRLTRQAEYLRRG